VELIFYYEQNDDLDIIESPIARSAAACSGIVHRFNGVLQHGTHVLRAWWLLRAGEPSVVFIVVSLISSACFRTCFSVRFNWCHISHRLR